MEEQERVPVEMGAPPGERFYFYLFLEEGKGVQLDLSPSFEKNPKLMNTMHGRRWEITCYLTRLNIWFLQKTSRRIGVV